MQYQAVYLERKTNKVFFADNDIQMRFVIMDADGTILTDLTGWTFKAKFTNNSDAIRSDTSMTITTSGAVITVLIANTETDTLEDLIEYKFQLVGTLSSKVYTLWTGKFRLGEDIVDF